MQVEFFFFYCSTRLELGISSGDCGCKKMVSGAKRANDCDTRFLPKLIMSSDLQIPVLALGHGKYFSSVNS